MKFQLNIFVHQQKGCQRVLSYTCDYCDGVARIPEKTQMTIGGFYKAMTSISKVLEILSTHKKNEKASEEEKANLAILEDVELKKRENKERKKEEKLKISELKNEDSKAEKTPEDTEMTSEAIIAEQSPTVSFSNYKNLKNEIQKVLKASSLFENIPRPLQEDPPRDPEPTVTQAESNNCENCEKLLADLQKIAEENEKLKAEKSQKSPENWQAEKQEMQLKIQELHNENIRIKAENNANLRMIQQLLDKLNKNQ
ncbi:hypothetical protein B9Z55_004352 [Caenorhabditis nigoni]|nr:hypothetical protein B9Z55_004352 [Caenorhabditis nigoni]